LGKVSFKGENDRIIGQEKAEGVGVRLHMGSDYWLFLKTYYHILGIFRSRALRHPLSSIGGASMFFCCGFYGSLGPLGAVSLGKLGRVFLENVPLPLEMGSLEGVSCWGVSTEAFWGKENSQGKKWVKSEGKTG